MAQGETTLYNTKATMSGHSKWSTIKRKKGIKDQEKGKIFSKLSKMITISVIEGGGFADPEINIKLRMAVEKAKAANMPKDNIARAIEKAAGPEKNQLKEVVYEGFGPEGMALIIVATTDNPNRTISEVRNTLEKMGGKLGSQGSVAYLFHKCGSVVFNRVENSEEKILAFGDEVGAFDVEEDPESTTLYFPFENMGKIRSMAAEIEYKPTSPIVVTDEAKEQRIFKIIEAVEGLDDVQKVFVNTI